MKKRILFNIILFIAVFYTPWYFPLAFVAFGVFVFPLYAEAIFFGFILDLLYGTTSSSYFGIVDLISSFVIFVVIFYVKKAIRN